VKIKLFLMVLIVLLLIPACGQAETTPNDLVGTWSMSVAPNSILMLANNNWCNWYDPIQRTWSAGQWSTTRDNNDNLILIIQYNNGRTTTMGVKYVNKNKILCTITSSGTGQYFHLIRR